MLSNNTLKFLPHSLKHLTLGPLFNEQLDWLPPSLTHLVFGRAFNQPISIPLPSSLTHLTFGKKFNQVVDLLPLDALTHLKFGKHFKQPLDFPLPSLISLSFPLNSRFNHPVACLSLSLTCIKFGRAFDQPIYVLPNTLEHISVFSTYPYIRNLQHVILGTTITLTIRRKGRERPSSIFCAKENEFAQ